MQNEAYEKSNETAKVLFEDLLMDAELMSFSWQNFYTIKFLSGNRDLWLQIWSDFWFGDADVWQKQLSHLSGSELEEETQAQQAFWIRKMMNAFVKQVDLSDNGNLFLTTDYDVSLRISGRVEAWEDSWILRESQEISGTSKYPEILGADHTGKLIKWDHLYTLAESGRR